MPDAVEIKDVLAPDDAGPLLALLKAGTLTEGISGPWDKVQKKEFPTGPDAKQSKIDAAREGFVFVQRGILLYRGATEDAIRVLLHGRNAHVITKGLSVLSSGSVQVPPAKAVGKKVIVAPPLADEDFASLGLGLSTTDDGIHYVFDVSRGKLPHGSEVVEAEDPTPTKDPREWVTIGDAEKAVTKKAMEVSVLAAFLRHIRA